jgi:hypothetical protein
MQAHCQQCHRAGEIAPMPLTTYKEARPFAAAINEAVTLRKMPPWNADPRDGHFTNDISLSTSPFSPAGPKTALPKPPARIFRPLPFTEGWNIRKPDMVLQMSAPFSVPATGTFWASPVPGTFSRVAGPRSRLAPSATRRKLLVSGN